jgi:hypothetical protein
LPSREGGKEEQRIKDGAKHGGRKCDHSNFSPRKSYPSLRNVCGVLPRSAVVDGRIQNFAGINLDG